MPLLLGNDTAVVVDAYVTFMHLVPAQIGRNVAMGQPQDKAGAYAVQGWGQVFITQVSGRNISV